MQMSNIGLELQGSCKKNHNTRGSSTKVKKTLHPGCQLEAVLGVAWYSCLQWLVIQCTTCSLVVQAASALPDQLRPTVQHP